MKQPKSMSELDKALGAEQMAAIVDLVNEIESVNGECALTAENAWLPGAEPMTEDDRANTLHALRLLRHERDRLEGELDKLIEGLGR